MVPDQVVEDISLVFGNAFFIDSYDPQRMPVLAPAKYPNRLPATCPRQSQQR